MIRQIMAQYIGEPDDYFIRGRTYPLTIKTRWIRKKVSIYKRTGYYDDFQPGTYRDYKDYDAFSNSWGSVKEEWA